ncbi:MAG: site-2 protease family protein [Actinomycetota bacterium]|nr:site-2 protease family protein [Actinomycetota bacterium]
MSQYDFPERDYEPIQPRSGLRDLLKKIWAPIAAVGALLVKFGAVLFKAKFLFSIFVSAAVYVWIGGWWFGIGLVVLLFVHEMGHVLEAKRQGLPVSAPFFIPFLGAAIQMKRMPQSAWHEALNGIAGPILGSIGAGAVWAIGAYYDSRPLIALAFLGFLINLFNLVPFLPLDGGRIAVAIHPGIVAVGLVALIALVIVQPNPILILILIFGGMETWRRWQSRNHPEAQEYYRVRPWQRIVIAILYFGLAAFLVFAMGQTHVPRDF